MSPRCPASAAKRLWRRPHEPVSPETCLPVAWTYLGLRETAAALEWMEAALAERDPFLGSVMVFPAYDAIRDQPRFKRLAHHLKLSP